MVLVATASTAETGETGISFWVKISYTENGGDQQLDLLTAFATRASK